MSNEILQLMSQLSEELSVKRIIQTATQLRSLLSPTNCKVLPTRIEPQKCKVILNSLAGICSQKGVKTADKLQCMECFALIVQVDGFEVTDREWLEAILKYLSTMCRSLIELSVSEECIEVAKSSRILLQTPMIDRENKCGVIQSLLQRLAVSTTSHVELACEIGETLLWIQKTCTQTTVPATDEMIGIVFSESFIHGLERGKVEYPLAAAVLLVALLDETNTAREANVRRILPTLHPTFIIFALLSTPPLVDTPISQPAFQMWMIRALIGIGKYKALFPRNVGSGPTLLGTHDEAAACPNLPSDAAQRVTSIIVALLSEMEKKKSTDPEVLRSCLIIMRQTLRISAECPITRGCLQSIMRFASGTSTASADALHCLISIASKNYQIRSIIVNDPSFVTLMLQLLGDFQLTTPLLLKFGYVVIECETFKTGGSLYSKSILGALTTAPCSIISNIMHRNGGSPVKDSQHPTSLRLEAEEVSMLKFSLRLLTRLAEKHSRCVEDILDILNLQQVSEFIKRSELGELGYHCVRLTTLVNPEQGNLANVASPSAQTSEYDCTSFGSVSSSGDLISTSEVLMVKWSQPHLDEDTWDEFTDVSLA